MTFKEVKNLIEGLGKTILAYYNEFNNSKNDLEIAKKKIINIVKAKDNIILFYDLFNDWDDSLSYEGSELLEQTFNEIIQPIIENEGKKFLVA